MAETVFSHQKNDVSFTIDGKLVVLVEHQSTVNANMPLRFLLYVARVLENYIARKKAVYGRKLVKAAAVGVLGGVKSRRVGG